MVALPPEYVVRTARAGDLNALPAIELAAATSFAGYLRETGLTPAALEDVTSLADLEHAMNAGRLWVATQANHPVGFAQVEVVAGYAHLEEIDVHPAHARQGLGRALIETVCAWASARRFPAVTLTTFRDVPWNAPYYERLGFITIDPAMLSVEHAAIVRDEQSRGFDPARRVTMMRRT